MRLVGGGQNKPCRYPLLQEEDVPHVGHRGVQRLLSLRHEADWPGDRVGGEDVLLCRTLLGGGGGAASASAGAAGLSSASAGASGMSSSWGSGTGSASSAALCGGGGGIRISRRGRPVLRMRRRLRHVLLLGGRHGVGRGDCLARD